MALLLASTVKKILVAIIMVNRQFNFVFPYAIDPKAWNLANSMRTPLHNW